MEQLSQRPDIERNKKIRSALSILFRKNPANAGKVQQEIIDRHDYLTNKYPNAGDYAVLRDLISSTPGAEPIYDDFPGDDSIEKFVEKLLQKYG